MKAGTTWLYDQLKNHPEIYTSPEKETHYFGSVTGRWDLISHEARLQRFYIAISGKSFDEIKQSINWVSWYANYASPVRVNDSWYQSLFEGAKAKYCADYCNLNSNLDEIGWRRVRQNYNKQLKVVYCLRDPFKRLWSHYKFHMEWIGEGHNIIANGLDGFKSMIEQDWFYDIARYDLAIDRLQNNLLETEYKILYFEDFRTQPQLSLDSLCDFLDVSRINFIPSESDNKVNASLDIKMPEEWRDYLWSYLSPVYSALEEKGLIHSDWIKNN